MRCPLHTIHNTAHKGSAGFTSNATFDSCIDIFYSFDKSRKLKNVLQGYADFCDQDYRHILKHINVLCLVWKGLLKEFCCNIPV